MEVLVPEVTVTSVEESIVTGYQVVVAQMLSGTTSPNASVYVVGLGGGSEYDVLSVPTGTYIEIPAPSGTSVIGGGIALRNDTNFYVNLTDSYGYAHNVLNTVYSAGSLPNEGGLSYINGPTATGNAWIFQGMLQYSWYGSPTVSPPPNPSTLWDGNWGYVYAICMAV